ncbi:MAG: hypothetical protein R3C49_22645 [Planctomycetaceae bacterium]
MMNTTEPTPGIAWISQGRLYVRQPDGVVREIESDFATRSVERELKHQSGNAWKGRSGIWGELGMAPPGMAPWAQGDPRRRIRFVAVMRGDTPDEIFYVMDMGPVGGLFQYNLTHDEETRLMHSQDFRARDLSRHPVERDLAVSVVRQDGTMGLTITRHDGLFGRPVTLSDSIDEAPSWLPDGSRRLVFQSSAILRNENGYATGSSCCRLELLDLDGQEITCVLEDAERDLLQPRQLADESLLYIRRPWKSSHRQPPTLLEVAKDVFLFPFRLGRTFVYFFNFMSMALSGKPLMSAGGPGEGEPMKPNRRQMLMLYGQAVDTQHAMAAGAGKDPHRPLVPKEWQLVHRTKDGQEDVLAENVLGFDATPNGEIVYTDGRRIFSRSISRSARELMTGDVIEKVALLGMP